MIIILNSIIQRYNCVYLSCLVLIVQNYEFSVLPLLDTLYIQQKFQHIISSAEKAIVKMHQIIISALTCKGYIVD